MKSLTRYLTNTTAVSIIALIMATNAHSAGYLKIGDIKGESKAQASSEQREIDSGSKPRPAGLLLPAVQSAREAARSSKPAPKPSNDHSSGDEHEVEYDVAAGV